MAERIGLSYEQAPPFGVPFAFFLAAPFFLLLAALTALADPLVWMPSRWMPASLALTHLLTLGFLGMVMLGAALQMVPVVLGSSAPGTRLVARVGVPGLSIGTLLLALGLWQSAPSLLYAAMAFLGVGLMPALTSLGIALTRARSQPWLVWPIRQAWLALLITVLLGLTLSRALAGAWSVGNTVALTNLHAAWGLGGWIVLLVLGFAFQVVPMLQLTPNYPDWATRWMSRAVFVGLTLFTLALIALPDMDWVAWIALAPALAGVQAFAGVTMHLQRHRRRKIADVTLDFWRLGMAILGACTLLMPMLPWLPEAASVSLGIAFLLGFGASVVQGMLYKIVPFLAWFHLQAQTQARAGKIPNMKQLLSEQAARRHLQLHVFALPWLIGAPLIPSLWPACLSATCPAQNVAAWAARVGALALAASALLLWHNLYRVRRMFLQHGGHW